jgi:hypothetical protein
VTEDEAWLMVRMQLALVGEGILHEPDPLLPGWGQEADKELIREAARTAWDRMDARQKRCLRHWAPGT